MSNLEKAEEVLNLLDHEYNYSEGEWPDNETVVKALADAGLLAPDLPEPDVTSANGTPVWRADKTLMVTAFPNMVGMWLPDTGEAQYTPGAARAQALALLAAANYAENSHEPDQRET